MKYYFGIDFGTTNSATVAIIPQQGWSKCIKFGDEFNNPIPSLIAIDKESGEIFFGRKAWEKRNELSSTCEVISSIKSYLDTDKTWTINDKLWTPEDVVSYVFKKLKEEVKKSHNLNMDEAVVSIPVGFSSTKRKVLRKAAHKAGIYIKSFVSESTSVIFKNYDFLSHYRNIAIFDWGGGTLDVSIIKNIEGKIYELETKGIKLGGDDIDLKIAIWAHQQIMKMKDGLLRFEDMDPKFQDNLIVRAERAKRNLNEDEDTIISIPRYGEYGAVRIKIDKNTLGSLIKPEIDMALNCLEGAVKSARISLKEIDCIVMVGGSSNLETLQNEIQNRWSEYIDIIYPDESDWNVAEGASLLNINTGKVKINQNLGIILSDNTFYPLMHKDDSVENLVERHVFGIVTDDTEARFIFSDGVKNLGYQNVPVYGFFQEQIQCETKIDEDLVCNIVLKSSNRSDVKKRTWKYENLKFYYELPSICEEV